MPAISVLIPVYNGGQYIEKAVRSVMSQTFPDWELIVLDDGSSDNSPEILRALAAVDCRIKILAKENDGNGNTAANIKIMGKAATGDYAFYMSQDDWLSPDILENMAARAAETGAEIVVPEMALAFADGSESTDRACCAPPEGDFSRIITGKEAFLLSVDFRINGFALIRSGLMFDARCDTRYFDSDELNTRLQFLWADKVAFCRGKFFYYQGNENAMTRKFSVKMFQRLRTSMLLAEAFGKSFPEKMKDPDDSFVTLRAWQMRTYVSLAVMYLTHCGEFTEGMRRDIRQTFRDFETAISFSGTILRVLRRMNGSEKAFCIFFFLFGSCLKMQPLHRAYHTLKRARTKATGKTRLKKYESNQLQ